MKVAHSRIYEMWLGSKNEVVDFSALGLQSKLLFIVKKTLIN